jgi:hypothetical protein
MNEKSTTEDRFANPSRAEILSAIFANMVMQQTNMAMMFLGKVPHPETGESLHDIDSAQMFIDQLEMLEAKTKGNLDKREEGLLKQSLMALRMAFVEAVEGKPSGQFPVTPPPKSTSTEPQSAPVGEAATGSAPAAPEAEAESRKKFTKKY